MKQSDCESVQNLLSLYIDNMLSDEETNIVREHIAGCASCREELALMQSILKETKHLPEIEVSADFHQNLMDKIKAEGKPEKKFALNWKQAASFVAAAAVVALSVVSFLSLERDPGSEDIDTYITTPAPEKTEGASAAPAPAEEQEPSEETKTASPGQPKPTEQTAKKTVMPKGNQTSSAQAKKTEKASPIIRENQPVENHQEPAKQQVENRDSSDAEPAEPYTVRTRDTGGEAAHSGKENGPAARNTVPAEEVAPAAHIAKDSTQAPSDGQAFSGSEETKSSASAAPKAEASAAAKSEASAEAKSSSGGSSGGGGGAASGGASRPKGSTYRIAAVTVSEHAKADAVAILSAYAKDANGYKVGESLQTVLNQLSALEGYSVSTQNANHVSANYIALK